MLPLFLKSDTVKMILFEYNVPSIYPYNGTWVKVCPWADW